MKKNTILEFFDVLSGKITNCFLSKNTLSKLDLTESNERSSIDFLSTLGLVLGEITAYIFYVWGNYDDGLYC